MNAQPRPIRRDDLEAKMRELEGEVTETRESVTTSIVTVGAIAVVVVIAIAFLMGRRKGKKRTTVVEVRRL